MPPRPGPPVSPARGGIGASMPDTKPKTTPVRQPVTDDSIKVRQLTHYQFSWIAGEPAEEGTFTLQLVLDEGAWEEVLTVDAEDAEVLQSLLKRQEVVHYDIRRRTLMFGTTPVGS